MHWQHRFAKYRLAKYCQRSLTGFALIMATTYCAAASQEGRYIVYLTPDALASANADKDQQAMVAQWEKSLAGQVHLERVLATGGWVISVVSEAESPQAQQTAIEQLSGVGSVERDAMLRHR